MIIMWSQLLQMFVMRKWLYAYPPTHPHTHTHTHTHTLTLCTYHLYIYTDMYMYTCMQARTQIHTYTQTYTYKHLFFTVQQHSHVYADIATTQKKTSSTEFTTQQLKFTITVFCLRWLLYACYIHCTTAITVSVCSGSHYQQVKWLGDIGMPARGPYAAWQWYQQPSKPQITLYILPYRQLCFKIFGYWRSQL